MKAGTKSVETSEELENKRSNNDISVDQNNSKRLKLESEIDFLTKREEHLSKDSNTESQEQVHLTDNKQVRKSSLSENKVEECLDKQSILQESSTTFNAEILDKKSAKLESCEESIKTENFTRVSGAPEGVVTEKQTSINRRSERKSTESHIKEPIIQSPDSSLSDKNKKSFDFGAGSLEIVDVTDDKSITLNDSFDQGFAVVSEVVDDYRPTKAVETGIFGKSIKVVEDLSVIEEVSERTETDRTIVASDRGISRSGTLEFDIDKGVQDLKKTIIDSDKENLDTIKSVTKSDKKITKSEIKESKILESEEEVVNDKKAKLAEKTKSKVEKQTTDSKEESVNQISKNSKEISEDKMSGKYSMKYSASSHVEGIYFIYFDIFG